jgi:hypothetical protein
MFSVPLKDDRLHRYLVKTLAALALCAAGSSATAASYDFSFSNVGGDVAGDVKGFVVLPDGDGVFAILDLGFYQVPTALGYASMAEVISDFSGFYANSFTVSGGIIDPVASTLAVDFGKGDRAFALNHTDQLAGRFGSLLSARSGAGWAADDVRDRNDVTRSLTRPPPCRCPPRRRCWSAWAVWPCSGARAAPPDRSARRST